MNESKLGKKYEGEPSAKIPCFRIVTAEELQIIDEHGYITRASQHRDDTLPPERKQDKLEGILLEYLDSYLSDSPTAINILNMTSDKVEFIRQSLGFISGLEPNDNEIINRIAQGEASAREIRLFFTIFMPKDFNIVVQTATTTPFSNLISVTYGGILNTSIPKNRVLLELQVPANQIIFDTTTRNSMENELLVEKIESTWIQGRYTTSEQIIEMLRRRQDLPVQKFLRGVDFSNEIKINHALHLSKRVLIDDLMQSKLVN